MSAVYRTTEPPPATETVGLRISNQAVVTLQLLAIEIRYRSGARLSRSAILRGLIRWLETCDIDTRTIRSRNDLRTSLLLAVASDHKDEGV